MLAMKRWHWPGKRIRPLPLRPQAAMKESYYMISPCTHSSSFSSTQVHCHYSLPTQHAKPIRVRATLLTTHYSLLTHYENNTINTIPYHTIQRQQTHWSLAQVSGPWSLSDWSQVTLSVFQSCTKYMQSCQITL